MMDSLLNRYRVFPRLMMAFMMWMMWRFHLWFTANGALQVTDMSEWAIVGYATVMGTFVGFAKYYLETGNNLGKD